MIIAKSVLVTIVLIVLWVGDTLPWYWDILIALKMGEIYSEKGMTPNLYFLLFCSLIGMLSSSKF